ncbi:hypothetical protein [Amycolatopsis sp. DSM 110486]|uniref:hypothetical protein n=1 Tax=Amycolatopsis sp. DSM 110486 TaxID=2865832 RepID=UPI001C699E4F|nr:hypothetical protein [Amycolatopsis sp. DSM 110486]QYN25084.1 hypothetical protein K1T34_23195 [Amycolatopsis sp. DSM 110486]
MKLRALAVAAAAVVVTGLGAVPASAETWHATLLPLPKGHEDATGFLMGTDGHGGFAGEFAIDGTSQVVTWTNGQPTVRGLPAGYEFARVVDENSSGVVLGDAVDYDTGLSRGFLLDGNGFHLLPEAPGYVGSQATALNDRGDVLALLFADDPAKDAVALWPVLGQGLVIVPHTGEWADARDLDEDGTVLFSDHLWKNGGSTPLTLPAGYSSAFALAIRDGVVVGFANPDGPPPSQAFRWTAPDRPEPLPQGDQARFVNSTGLSAGQLPNLTTPNAGAPFAWQDTTPLGKLPLPDGYRSGDVHSVGDDDTIGGIVSNGPLDEGGAPVIWER